jgi:cell wall-associated NlpC family hydrolase
MEARLSERPSGPVKRVLATVRRAGVFLPAALALVGVGAVAALRVGGDGAGKKAAPPKQRDTDPVLTPSATKGVVRKQPRQSGGHVVHMGGVGAQPKPAPKSSSNGAADSGPSPGAPSDAQVRADLREARAALRSFQAHLAGASLATGPRAKVLRDGSAQAPEDAPDIVKKVILAGNEIAKFPYKWGGGHGAWRDSGYDCSGSVSFALAGAGFLHRPLTSGGFMSWGRPGRGKWITIYASPGHVFMFVAGLRFDTSGRGRAGTRWQEGGRMANGFVARHPAGF